MGDTQVTRKNPTETIKKTLTQKLGSLPGAIGFSFPPPAIPGVGAAGGAAAILQDRAGKDLSFLSENTNKFLEAAKKRPGAG